jgi:hypothetical protein
MNQTSTTFTFLPEEKAVYYYRNLRKIWDDKSQARLKILNLLRSFLYISTSETQRVFSGLDSRAVFIFEHYNIDPEELQLISLPDNDN